MNRLYAATIMGCSFLTACASQPQHPVIGQPGHVDSNLVRIVEKLTRQDEQPLVVHEKPIQVLAMYNEPKNIREVKSFLPFDDKVQNNPMVNYNVNKKDEELVRRMQEDTGDQGLGKSEAKELALRKLANMMDAKFGGFIFLPIGSMTALFYDTKRKLHDYGKIKIGDLKGKIRVGGSISGVDEVGFSLEYPVSKGWKLFLEVQQETDANDIPENPLYREMMVREQQNNDWINGRIPENSYDRNNGQSIFFGIKKKF
ncbi:MAG: hypothetical protein Q7R96_03455 [Nanoarchaeota archaeon]|nr:hypothetical protein [Nanoarchaeota archaeon]